MGGRFGKRRARRRGKTTYGGALGLGVGALALVGTISLLLLLRRRARRKDSSTEKVNEDLKTEEAEGPLEREEARAEGHREYFRKLIEETNKRSRSSGRNREARRTPAHKQEAE
jgi:hypothetical protein